LTNNTYKATFTHNGTSEYNKAATASIPAEGTGHDWGGNGNSIAAASSVFTLDTQKPSLLTGSAFPASINLNSLTLPISLVFTETMNTGINPTVAFVAPDANLVAGVGAWSTTNVTNDTYSITYTHNGTVEEIAGTTASASGG